MTDDLGKDYIDKVRAPRNLTPEDEEAITQLLAKRAPQAQDGLGLGVAGIYTGGVLWGVRWTENSLIPPQIYTYRDESFAREMLAFLLERHERFELANKGIPKPELVAARLTWAVQK